MNLSKSIHESRANSFLINPRAAASLIGAMPDKQFDNWKKELKVAWDSTIR